jgi:hypothetical protein
VEDRPLIDRNGPSDRFRTALLLAVLLPFVVLCTMNSATYRYGASDQAFYIPAVVLAMHPDYFPRDASVIRAQATLTLVDDAMARLSSATGIGLPVLSFALYAGSLLLLATAAWLIASRLYRTHWTALALLSALTLRHSISRTGTNTLEGYFHPRQLAFGLGALGVAFILRRRVSAAAVTVLLAGAIHPTTALWFGIWLTVAVAINEPRWRRGMAAAFAAAGILALWALTAGPLGGRLSLMDPEWLATLDTKDYLFPLEWPAATWLFNLAYVAIIAAIYRWRRAIGCAGDGEGGVALGALALVALFAAGLPFNAAHVALAVQLQSSRMFWMLDFLATIYIVWAVAEGPAPTGARAQLAAAGLVLLSLARGGYVKFVEFPQRPLAQLDIPDNDWGRAMAWARSTDIRSHWLADPIHAARYGMSLRVAGERDVFVEGLKDAAIGMYDRSIAIRTRDRLAAIGSFDALTADRARALAATYDIDYLLAERPFDLPLTFQSGELRIYRLR